MSDIRVCQAACGTTPHPGSKPVVCLPAPKPPSVAISVGTTPMIAIPGAAFMGSVAMIVGSTRQVCCNHFGHGRPMIAIPTADDCGSLQLFGGAGAFTCYWFVRELVSAKQNGVIASVGATPPR